jgi:hypothetical protein
MTDQAVAKVSKNPILQVVDGDGVLNPTLEQELVQWGFADIGDSYYVVSILGAQSSGKSTLMNMLFGTDFSVMIAKTGRRQTTLGVWLGLAPPDKGEEVDTDTVLVLDVEGTDSRERGEDHGSFERKTSLFSLALSEILIINMWTTDVGLHDGANYSLLKVVFELNLQLFQQSSNGNKTLLLFLFRDHTLPEDEEHTPLDYFVKVISEDMDKIWSTIAKTEGFAQSKVTDFFEFRFVSLPHKVHKSKEFKAQVAELKHRFLDPKNPDRLLSKNYKKDIPADGFAKYATNIWSVIQENKDLNIPTQKEMLSMFRCEQMANAAVDEFVKALEAIQAPLDRGELVQSFGSRINLLIEHAYEQYDASAKRYVASVASSKRSELTEKLALSAAKLLRLQLRLILNAEIASLVDSIKTKVTNQKIHLSNFLDTITNIRDNALESFEKKRDDCEILALRDVAAYSTSPEDGEFQSIVKTRIDTIRKEQFQMLMSAASKNFERSLGAWATAFIEGGGSKDTSSSAPFPTFLDPTLPITLASAASSAGSGILAVKVTPGLVKTWDDIQTKYETVKTKFIEEMKLITAQLRIEEGEAEAELQSAQQRCLDVLFKVFRDMSNNVGWLMERRFSALFKFDANRIPRRWKPSDDINGEFKKACLQAERLLDQVSVIRLLPHERGFSWLETNNGIINSKSDVDSVPEAMAVMSLSEVSRALEQFREKARSDFIQATHAQETAVKGSYTAIVALVMFLLFGWDEMMYLLTNPLALALVCVLATAAFGFYHLGLFPVIAPVVNTVVAIVSQALAGGLQQAAPVPEASSSAPHQSDEIRRSDSSSLRKEKLD